MAKHISALILTLRGHWAAVAIFSMVVGISAAPMFSGVLSDDQITYWRKAVIVLEGGSAPIWWEPNSTFSFILAHLYPHVHDTNAAFVAIYCITAFLYLIAMYWALMRLVRDQTAAILVAVISLVPRYTLGMTYWGFGGFEFVKARILIMPMVPLIMKLYLVGREKTAAVAALMLCALAALLNFEAIYLGAAFCICLALFVLTDQQYSRKLKLNLVLGMMGFLVTVGMIYSYRLIMNKYAGTSATVFEFPIYSHLEEVLRGEVLGLSAREYLDRYWGAAYKAFWWGMFPPSVSDLALFLSDHMVVIGLAVFGAREIRRNDPALFKRIIQLSIAIMIVAYGFQLTRWAGRYLFGWPPVILEEVRAFKFLLFPIFIFLAAYFSKLKKRGRAAVLAIVFVLSVISPMQALRALPTGVKAYVLERARVLLSPEKAPYLEKVVGWKDPDESYDMQNIIGVLTGLRASGGTAPVDGYVLSTDHRVKLSGWPVIISYQDKRAGYSSIFVDEIARRNSSLVLWDLAYREIESAVISGDAGRIYSTARKYRCAYIVTPVRLEDPRFVPIYEGRSRSCYRITPALNTVVHHDK